MTQNVILKLLRRYHIRIGYCFDALNEEGEGVGSDVGLGHVNLREGEKGTVLPWFTT